MNAGKIVPAAFIACLMFVSPSVAEEGKGDANRNMSGIICSFVYLVETVAAALVSMVIVFAGVKHLVAGDDPSARNSAKTWIVNAFVSILVIFTAVPIINFSTRGMTGQYSCEIAPGERMFFAGSGVERPTGDVEMLKDQEKARIAEEDRVYNLLLGKEPVRGGTDDAAPAAGGKSAAAGGGGFNMPDYLLLAFLLMGLSILFTVGVALFKMREQMKK